MGMIPLILLICFLSFIFLLVNASTVQSVYRLSKVDDLFEEVARIDDVEFDVAIADSKTWAEQNNFELKGFFLLHILDSGVPLKCVSWWSDKHKIFFQTYFLKDANNCKVTHDFVTSFIDHGLLTTCTDIDGLFLPCPPTARVQYTRKSNFLSIMNYHLESVQSVCEKQGLVVNSANVDVYPLIRGFLRDQSKFIMSLPFWKYRGAYWFFVKKYLVSFKKY